jgi:hypothetical protein
MKHLVASYFNNPARGHCQDVFLIRNGSSDASDLIELHQERTVKVVWYYKMQGAPCVATRCRKER